MITDRYYYMRLSQENKEIYAAMYKAVAAHLEEVTIGGTVDIDTVTDIYSAMLRDNPHLFYMGKKVEIIQYTGAVIKTVIRLHYTLSREAVWELNGRIEDGVNSLINTLGLGELSDADAVKRLHDYFVTEVEYDNEAVDDGKPGRKVSAHSVIGIFSKRCAVCDGISYTAKLVLNAIDIPCIVVAGTSSIEQGGGHAWNIVKIGGKPFHLDITWDINLSSGGKICYDYYNIPDAAMRRDHEWEAVLPACTSQEENSRVAERAAAPRAGCL